MLINWGVYGPEMLYLQQTVSQTWPVNPNFPLSEWTQHMAGISLERPDRVLFKTLPGYETLHGRVSSQRIFTFPGIRSD